MNLTGLKRKPCSLWLLLKNSHWKDKAKAERLVKRLFQALFTTSTVKMKPFSAVRLPTFQEMLRELEREVKLL